MKLFRLVFVTLLFAGVVCCSTERDDFARVQEILMVNEQLFDDTKDYESKIILGVNSVSAIQSYLDKHLEGEWQDVAHVALTIWQQRLELSRNELEAERGFSVLDSILSSNEKAFQNAQIIKTGVNTCAICESSILAIENYLQNHAKVKSERTVRSLLLSWNQRLLHAGNIAPRLIDSVAPVYPELAKRAGIEGTVWISLLVDTDGVVAEVAVEKSSGTNAGLEQAAIDAAWKATFIPANRCGESFSTRITLPYHFSISG